MRDKPASNLIIPYFRSQKQMKMKMISCFFLSAVLFTLSSCSGVRIKEHAEWKKYFDQFGVEGCIEIYDNNKEIAAFYNKERVATPFTPASTFKIVNSLIALETGVAPDEQMVIKWDGKEREIENWNQDLSMSEAFKYSAVPYYQELARRIGRNKMQYYLDTLKYGNMKIGDEVDQFWLNGTLRISADEQVGLMKRLYHGELPAFSERSQRIVRGMMLQEEGEHYRLYYKTGKGHDSNKDLYWMVGYLEQFVPTKHTKTQQINDIPHPYFFAINISTNDDNKDMNAVRINILKEILKDQNIKLN